MGTLTFISLQLFQSLFMIAIAPLLLGWIRQMHAWLGNKSGAGIFQPYREIRKLFLKEPVIAENASFIFRGVPYLYFACMCCLTLLIPVLTSSLLFSNVADVIVLAGVFTLVRIFMALAAMDIGTAFGSMGARREMLVAFLVEPVLLIIFFNLAMISQSTSLSSIVNVILVQPLMINPSLVFAAIAFFMVLLAENARIPIDNPSTHLELTMIHEAMILEYSGRYLALMEWASDLKLLNYFALAAALFVPFGISSSFTVLGISTALIIFIGKLLILSSGLVFFEVITAKIRIFRVPEFLTCAFLLAIFGVLIQLLIRE